MIVRETAYAALFARLLGLRVAGLVKTCDRRVRFLEDMARSELPALFMAIGDQPVQTASGLPSRHVLKARLYLYAENPDRHTSADMALNGLIDAVEALLEPPPGQGAQTLDGAVSQCRLDDSGPQVFPGPGGQRAAAIVPVRMLVP